MVTFMLVALFMVVVLACVVLLIRESTQGVKMDADAPARRDPFAPILRAGSETDDVTTIRMAAPR
jgi:hypothetical protein